MMASFCIAPNGRVELHAVLLGERVGKLINAPGAGGDIRAATEGGRDPCIGQWPLGFGIVNDLGEGGDVGSIQPDQANADFLAAAMATKANVRTKENRRVMPQGYCHREVCKRESEGPRPRW